MGNSYDLFSTFYREIITASGHLHNEQKTVFALLSKFNINKSAWILDAACGTGDLLKFLSDIGYYNIEGLDGSLGMISKAKDLLPNITFHHISWENLTKLSIKEFGYDIIINLSISLIHSQEEDIPIILSSFYHILKKRGYLLFDNRKWMETSKGYIEKDRPINRYRRLQPISLNNYKYNISDICTYKGNRQIVEYNIKSDNNLDSTVISVSYARIPTSNLIKTLTSIGFSKVNHFTIQSWPYEIIYAIK